jgi:hypothetical protein
VKDVLPYLVQFYALAKGKLTTMVALLTALLSEVLGNWDAAAALFPPWVIAHRAHIVSASALLAIWTRVRRQIPAAVEAAK